MKDGSDAVGDWPILNALINAVIGASWVGFHHGGGVGMGYSLHAGQVIVADGTEEAARRVKRSLQIRQWGYSVTWMRVMIRLLKLLRSVVYEFLV